MGNFYILFLVSQVISFNLKDIKGNEVNLDSLLKKGPVILDFWATWCKYCDEVLDILQEINEEYEGKVSIVALSWDSGLSQSKILPLAESRGWKFPIVMDSDRKIGKKFGVIVLPTTIILSPEGEVVYRKLGYNPKEKEELKKIIDKFLKK